MVTIHPCMTIGDSRNGRPSNSVLPIKKLLKGEMPVIPNLSWSFVNVRDVGLIHVLAMENEKAKGRYICSTETRSAKQIRDLLFKKYADKYPLPSMDFTGFFGGLFIYGFAYFQDKLIKDSIQKNLGMTYTFDNSRMKELGIKPIDVDSSIIETAEDLIKLEKF